MIDQFCAIILAAGKGTRLNSRKSNKVVRKLNNQPMVKFTADLLEKLGLKNVIVVVGFKSGSVQQALGPKYKYVVQSPQLGTGHAVLTALPHLPKNCSQVLVLNADDSAFYQPQDIKDLIKAHLQSHADMTLLTVIKNDPPKLGRVIRNNKNKVQAIVEFKNASDQQKQIKEINTATYCFSAQFLNQYLPQLKLNPVAKEYYLTDLLETAVSNHKPVAAVQLSNPDRFQGVNTRQDLELARRKMKQKNKA